MAFWMEIGGLYPRFPVKTPAFTRCTPGNLMELYPHADRCRVQKSSLPTW